MNDVSSSVKAVSRILSHAFMLSRGQDALEVTEGVSMYTYAHIIKVVEGTMIIEGIKWFWLICGLTLPPSSPPSSPPFLLKPSSSRLCVCVSVTGCVCGKLKTKVDNVFVCPDQVFQLLAAFVGDKKVSHYAPYEFDFSVFCCEPAWFSLHSFCFFKIDLFQSATNSEPRTPNPETPKPPKT